MNRVGKTIAFIAGLVLASALGAVALGQTSQTDGDFANAGTDPANPALEASKNYTTEEPLSSCPNGETTGEVISDYDLPSEGAQQTPEEALAKYVSYHPEVGDPESFHITATDDGAVSGSKEESGRVTVLVQFAELAPDYWVVGKHLQCWPVQKIPATDSDQAEAAS